MFNDSFQLHVVVDGRRLPIHHKDGKNFVEALDGKDYEIELVVPSFSRTAAVVSVDGLSVMTGKRASVNDGAYVIGEGGVYSGKIPGFRLNNSEVARFNFTKPDESYAALMDKPENIGVIAVVFYREKPRRHPDLLGGGLEMTRGGGHTFGGGMKGGGFLGGDGIKGGVNPTSARHDIGTGFGDRAEHKVQEVEFERGAEASRIVIEYASRAALIAAGVIVPPKGSPLGDVCAFPGDVGTGCNPPPGWR